MNSKRKGFQRRYQDSAGLIPRKGEGRVCSTSRETNPRGQIFGGYSKKIAQKSRSVKLQMREGRVLGNGKGGLGEDFFLGS